MFVFLKFAVYTDYGNDNKLAFWGLSRRRLVTKFFFGGGGGGADKRHKSALSVLSFLNPSLFKFICCNLLFLIDYVELDC